MAETVVVSVVVVYVETVVGVVTYVVCGTYDIVAGAVQGLRGY